VYKFKHLLREVHVTVSWFATNLFNEKNVFKRGAQEMKNKKQERKRPNTTDGIDTFYLKITTLHRIPI